MRGKGAVHDFANRNTTSAREQIGTGSSPIRPVVRPARRFALRRSARIRFGFSPLELQLVLDVVAGYDELEIARRASLGEDAVSRRLASTFKKIGVHDRLELVLFLISHGL